MTFAFITYYTKRSFLLYAFRHRGFWAHGRYRERRSMLLFAKLIKPGDIVFDVGGHIGHMAMYFSKLVSDNGRVVVF